MRLIKRLLRWMSSDSEPDWDTDERRAMLIDKQRSDYYND